MGKGIIAKSHTIHDMNHPTESDIIAAGMVFYQHLANMQIQGCIGFNHTIVCPELGLEFDFTFQLTRLKHNGKLILAKFNPNEN